MRKTVILVIAMFMLFPHLLVEGSTSYPDVNQYIASKKLAPVKVEYNHKDFPIFNYRYGKGMVEGVVAHETANDYSTLSSEIAYMSKHYDNAFVHAFVDGSHIVEIHSPDYGAWGAGSYANQRFVHVELVRVHTFDQFARSINNYASYIASILYHYDLPVTSAEKNGIGTLWSHNAVTKFLGATTHGDPLGYFTKWGYSWDKFAQLVTSKFNQLPDKVDSTNKLGMLRSGNAVIYSVIPDTVSAATVSTDTVYYIKKVKIEKGQIFYLLSNDTGDIGWVKESNVSTLPATVVDNTTKMFLIKGTGSAFRKEWGGKQDTVFANLSAYKGQFFKVQLTEKVGASIWYRGLLGGQTVWIDSNGVEAIKEINTSQLGHIKNSSTKIYKYIGDESTVVTTDSTYLGTVYSLNKQAIANGQTYYLVSGDHGVVGWMKSSDLTVMPSALLDTKVKMLLIKGTGRAYSKGWGGSKDIVIGNLSGYHDQWLKAVATERIGTALWYRGVLGGKTVWISLSNLFAIKESSTSRLGFVKSGGGKIYKRIGDSFSSFSAGSTYTNSVFYIMKQAAVKDQTYYLLSKLPSSVSGVIGWVNATDLSTQSHTVVDHRSKKFVVKGAGTAYSKPWGGKKDIIYLNLSKYKGKIYQVSSTEKVGQTTWYCGVLSGKKVWIGSVPYRLTAIK